MVCCFEFFGRAIPCVFGGHAKQPALESLDQIRAGRQRLLDMLQSAMDTTPWNCKQTFEGGITVESGLPSFEGVAYDCEAFHTFSESSQEDAVTLQHFASFFHDACHFADTSNTASVKSQIIQVLSNPSSTPDADYEAIVRTAFDLPYPLQNREFLHYVTTQKAVDDQGRDIALVAYASFDEAGDRAIPPPWEGYLRCYMAPSGQRAKLLDDGRVRMEHCMTYKLGGGITSCAQNLFFHSGHVQAYFNEWSYAMQALRKEARHQASFQVRKAGPAKVWTGPNLDVRIGA